MLVSACPPSASPSGEAGGDTEFLKIIILICTQHQASGIQFLVRHAINVRLKMSYGAIRIELISNLFPVYPDWVEGRDIFET